MNNFLTLISRFDSFRWRFLGCSSVFIAIAIWKAPSLFTDPRFWAEEGSRLFSYCRDASIIDCFTLKNLESWLWMTNAAVYLSTLVPIQFAPTVTTYLALLLHLVVVGQIVAFSRVYELSLVVALLLSAAWALIPQSFEVWLNSTNLQWVASVSLILMLAMPTQWLQERRWRVCAWALLCGLSGPPSVLVLGMFALRAIPERKPVLVMLAAVMLLCVLVQVIVVTTHGVTAGRTRPTDLTTLIVPMLLQSVLAPLFSVDFASALGAAVATNRSFFDPATLGVILCGVALIAFTAYSGWIGTRRPIVFFFMVAWVSVSVTQTFFGLRPEGFLSGWIGGRYFMAGTMCLCLCLAWGTRSPDHFQRAASFLLLISISVVGAAQTVKPSWRAVFLEGPSWRDQINNCPVGSPCQVRIWPGSWMLTLKPK